MPETVESQGFAGNPPSCVVTDDGIFGFFDQYRWLSNFHIEDGYCVERLYQAAKVKPEYPQMIKRIMASSPGSAKRIGRGLDRSMMIDSWDDVKQGLMRAFIINKFANPGLRKMLLATGTKYLEETNDWHDNTWGNCVCLYMPNLGFGIKQSCRIRGQNLLGRLIMEVRELCRD